LIAACGLDCSECDIYRASNDPETARRISAEFMREGRDVRPEEIHCSGCRGDRSEHWSPDCWILECCVDRQGLDLCNRCSDFPCAELTRWGERRERYRTALERLRTMSFER